jgi:hypothetical protein
MAVLTGPLGPDGAIAEVRLEQTQQYVRALAKRGLSPRPPASVPALIDTGASRCALDRHVIAALKLEYWGTAPVLTPTTANVPVQRHIYGMRLTLGHGGPGSLVQVVEVVESDLAHLGFSMLLGRDVLADCRFVYNGKAGTFDLMFRVRYALVLYREPVGRYGMSEHISVATEICSDTEGPACPMMGDGDDHA